MEKTLTRKVKKIQEEAMPSAEPGKNGDRFWERPFNAKQSIERCQHFERRGTEFKVKSGLELLRAKLNLSHGALYPFYIKIGIGNDTAQRRMREARKFMVWAGIDEDVVEAMELAHKTCKLQDFTSESARVNPNEFQSYDSNGENSSVSKNIWGVNLWHSLRIIDTKLQKEYLGWTSEQQQEGKDALSNWARQLSASLKEARQLSGGLR